MDLVIGLIAVILAAVVVWAAFAWELLESLKWPTIIVAHVGLWLALDRLLGTDEALLAIGSFTFTTLIAFWRMPER